MKFLFTKNAISTFFIIALFGISLKTNAQEKMVWKNKTHSTAYNILNLEDVFKHHVNEYEQAIKRNAIIVLENPVFEKLYSNSGQKEFKNRKSTYERENNDKTNHYSSARKNKFNGKDIYLEDSSCYYHWDSELNDWVGGWKNIYFYNANGNFIEGFYYDWDLELNDWVVYAKLRYTYDTNGNMTEYIKYYWDSELNDWVGNYKYVYSYDANENLTELIWYSWNSGLNEWKQVWKDVYSYDTNGNMTEWINYDWDSELNEWVIDWKDVYSYDTNGNMTEWINYDWDSELNEWISDWKEVSLYNANGNLAEWSNYSWDSELNDWVGNWKDVYFYDTNENMTEHIKYYWASELNDWIEDSKKEYSFNTNGNMTEYINYDWDSELNDWVGIDKFVFYWSLFVGIDEFYKLETFKVFPNPSSGNINFYSEKLLNQAFKLELFNLIGQIIYNKTFYQSNKDYNIDLPEISDGLYILKIQGDNFVKTEKLIIE